VTLTRAGESGGSRLTGRNLLRAGSLGLRTRRVRAALSALGISIGIAAITGVLGISQSSKTGLLNELGQLGNLLTAQSASPGAELPTTAEGMVSRIGPVTGVTQIASLSSVYVYRTPLIPAIDTNGIALSAADPALPATVGATLAHGAFLNAATARYPAVVLGAETASLLGITSLAHPTQVWIGGDWFTVVGILNPVAAPVEQVTPLDAMAFIGFPIAEQDFAFDGHPTELYVRSVYTQVSAVEAVLQATVDPASPADVQVSFPSDVLQAELLTKGAYNTLFLGLGAVALLVGGVGIANIMVISVLERRSEIGLRRALGATRRHIAAQFLTEAVLLSLLGGLVGTILGGAATAIYAQTQHWQVPISALTLYGGIGIGAALAIGAIAGLYPATWAARLAPTQALRTV
jgi:putative ABC transport system permease protein